MSDSAAQAGLGDAALDAAVARWSADPRLAPLLRGHDGMLLVLDAQGARVLHASGSAADLSTAITDSAGQVRGSLRLAEQLRPAALPETGARLTRLRLDARRIARPTTCLVARAELDGGTVLLLAPTEPPPALRAGTARSTAETVAEPCPEPLSEPPVPAGRIVWRSDADGVLTQVSGASDEIAGSLTGRSWQVLAGSGEIVATDLLAAIDARRTFRGLSLTLRPGGPAREIDIELSGAPSARPTQPFAGFSGFGLVRASRGRPQEAAARRRSAMPAEMPAPLPELPEDEAVPQVAPPLRDETAAPVSPPPDNAASEHHEAVPVADEAAEAPGTTEDGGETLSAAGDLPAAPGSDLSTNEHAAFREIARALGARFAGDDEPARPAAAASETGRRGAVMAFPLNPAQAASSAFDAAVVAALDRLPAGVLVHRDAEIVFVNRRFLELTEYPDREALQAAGGLLPLLNRIGARGEGACDEPVSVTTGGGGLLALLIERSRVDWGGGPAELLLVRTAAQTDQARERIAQGLFEARGAAREREAQALLDHIEEGVATLDGDGRVIALNRSAAAILSGEPRELVGGTIADLFTPESGSTVEAALREARETGTSEPREASPRTGSHAVPLRLRIIRYSTADATRFCATLRESPPHRQPETAVQPPRASAESVSRADFLAMVSHEIRTPVSGILGHAEAMLSEKGALGNDRERDYLRDIRASGEHVLGVLDDLVDLARIEAGRIDLTFTDVALNDVVSNCIALMQPQAARDRIVVRTSLSPDLKPLVADERCMRQATLNIIANAIRLSEAGGQVIVSTTTAERGEIAFRVRDTGTGMTQAEIDSALEPFRGAGAAVPSAGLGLTLTKALVEANRGRLRITSRKNEGTLVEMLFPAGRALSA